MRQVNFEEVGMKNYGPYIDDMVLKFNKGTLTFITGPNGVGKTMALDAIPFCLYGTTSKGSKGDEVVNNVVGKDCHTWLTFSIDNDKYKIDRFHKHSKKNNTVILQKNGVEIKKGQKEVLPEIERIVCPQRTFMNTVMFGQKVKDFFTDLTDSDKKEIFRKILDLDIYQQYYKKADDILKQVRPAIVTLQSNQQINSSLLSDSQEQLKNLIEKKDEFEKAKSEYVTNFSEEIVRADQVLKELRESLIEYQLKDSDIEKTIKEIADAENRLRSITKDQEAARQEVKNQKIIKEGELIKISNEIKSEVLQKYQKAKDEASAEFQNNTNKVHKETDELNKKKVLLASEETKLQVTIGMAQQEIHKMDDALNFETATCPTCLQEIDEKAKKVLKERIQKLEKEITDYSNMFRENSLRQNELKEKRKELDKQIEDLLTLFQREKDKLEKEREKGFDDAEQRLQFALTKLNNMVLQKLSDISDDYVDKVESINKEIERLKRIKIEQNSVRTIIQQIESKINNQQMHINYMEKQLEEKKKENFDLSQIRSYEQKIKAYTAAIKESQDKLVVLERKVGIVDFWKSAFSPTGIPSMLIDESIPFMNRRVTFYLDHLTNNRYLVSFDTLSAIKSGEIRDKISVNVLDTYTKANSRIQLSGGQTRLIDISIILTLGDLQAKMQDVSFNILLFDEIFDSLDEENIGFVSKVLTMIKEGFKDPDTDLESLPRSIYLISHRHEDQLEADETLNIT
jgi:DNA repair exonuclease SbcCD ATPase subunit